MRVCYFGTYRDQYVRNRLMIDRLRENGIEVVECHARLWLSIEDREQAASGGWRKPSFWWRVLRAYSQLIWKYLHVGSYDLMIVGYPGQPDIPLARLLTWLRRKPLVWDVLMSIYLIALERKLEMRSKVTVSILQRLEQIDFRLPDRLLIDTQVYSRWYQQNYNIPEEKIRLLPLGADDRVFKPIDPVPNHGPAFRCLYYGSFIPNHGVQTIIEAARLLAEDPTIQFELIGRGPEQHRIMALAETYELTNVTFMEWMDEPGLVKKVACADLLLGTFGMTPQALMTMQNKIHEGLAMRVPVINGDSPVMRDILRHGETIYLCERENPASLAEAIRTLQKDPELRAKIAKQGYDYYQNHLSFHRLGDVLVSYLGEILEQEKS